MIHVLFVVVSQSVGGAELHTASLANGLDKRKFRVSLVHLKDEIDGSDALRGLNEDVFVFCAQVRKKLDVAAVRKLSCFVKSERVDVIVCTNEFALFYGWLTQKISQTRVPLAEIFHTTELRTRKSRLQMAFYRPFFQAADLVVFVCEQQRKYWCSKKLKLVLSAVIHNGIDVARFRNDFSAGEIQAVRAQFKFSPSDFVIGICASLRPEKSHTDLLEAMFLLRQRGHVFKCLIIGDGPERERIERVMASLGLQADVAITGYISDVRKHVAACNIMALVSHYIETFSLSALEAMALERPIIMSEVGGAAEQVSCGYNGQLFPAGDIRALAQAILDVKSGNADGSMGVNARNSVITRFSLSNMLAKYNRTFVSLAERSTANLQ